ncbi:MAG: hypothetical protein AAB575_06075 [Patescibacteria group bacterium]
MNKPAKIKLKWMKEPRGWTLFLGYYGLAIKQIEDRFHGTISLVQKDAAGKIKDIWDVCAVSGCDFKDAEQRLFEEMKKIALEKIKELSVFLTDDELLSLFTERRGIHEKVR